MFVDGTLGGGGHSAALLQELGPHDILFGCDVDPNALQTASERLSDYMNHDGSEKPLFIPIESNFGNLANKLPTVLHPHTKEPLFQLYPHNEIIIINNNNNQKYSNTPCLGIDGMLLDLGVSSHQIDEPERGFSFMRDGPLDMRMSAGAATGLSAADICNEFDERELQRIFSKYGDEPRAKTLAKAVVNHRPLTTTGQLVEAIASVTPAFAKNKRKGKTATCARIFQSLRIVVNNEDGVLEQVLSEACPMLLRPGGRLVCMSYHSMEDRATKRIMRDGSLDKNSQNWNEEKDIYGNYIGPPKPFRPIGKPIKATAKEVEQNPRARSAVLRVAERK
jgi:16S rRNA (cytosine1402-N4)-methyltransferase